MKLKYKVKNNQITVKIKLNSEENLNAAELDRFSRIFLRGFLKPRIEKSNQLEYVGPAGMSLAERLKKPISKRDFLLIMEQLVVAVQKMHQHNFLLKNLIMHPNYVFVNDSTKEVQFIYLPVGVATESLNLLDFIFTVAASVNPADKNDPQFAKRFIQNFKVIKPFDINKFEEMIALEDRSVVNAIKSQQVGQSGFMTNNPKSYFEHYGPGGKNTQNVQMPQNADINQYDEMLTGLLNEDGSTSENSNFAYRNEDETGLLNEDSDSPAGYNSYDSGNYTYDERNAYNHQTEVSSSAPFSENKYVNSDENKNYSQNTYSAQSFNQYEAFSMNADDADKYPQYASAPVYKAPEVKEEPQPEVSYIVEGPVIAPAYKAPEVKEEPQPEVSYIVEEPVIAPAYKAPEVKEEPQPEVSYIVEEPVIAPAYKAPEVKEEPQPEVSYIIEEPVIAPAYETPEVEEEPQPALSYAAEEPVNAPGYASSEVAYTVNPDMVYGENAPVHPPVYQRPEPRYENTPPANYGGNAPVPPPTYQRPEPRYENTPSANYGGNAPVPPPVYQRPEPRYENTPPVNYGGNAPVPPPTYQRPEPRYENTAPVNNTAYRAQAPATASYYQPQRQNNRYEQYHEKCEMTGLLVDDYDGSEETGLLVDDSASVRFPMLYRVLTGESVSINKPVFRLGKERSYVDYFVTNNIAVSRSHADIITRGNKYFVKDLNSKNRTFVNNQPIPMHIEVEIKNGDRVKLGNEEFIFYI